MKPARDTREAYRNCDPGKPLSPGDPAYIDLWRARNQRISFVERVLWMVEESESEPDSIHTWLISGHRGCGKSTELLRLRGALEEEGWAVAYFNSFDVLEQSDLEAPDVMVALCEQVALLAERDGQGFDENALQLVYDYFATEEIVRESKRGAELQTEGGSEVGGGVPGILKMFVKFRANMKGSEEVRKGYRREIERNFGVFSARLATLVRSAEDALQAAGKKGLVVIVDSLERLPYTVEAGKPSSHERFFLLNSDMLKCPPCRVFYTVPITLTTEQQLADAYGDSPMIVPMIDLTRPESHACLCDLLARRIDREAVFEPGADLNALVDASGGCVRDLLHMARDAVFGQTAPVGKDKIGWAIETLTKDFDRLFNDADIPTILRCGAKGRIDYDEVGRKLLYLRVILEYENGVRRMEPHPLVALNARIVAASQPPPPPAKVGI